jgi:hypothetical protein
MAEAKLSRSQRPAARRMRHKKKKGQKSKRLKVTRLAKMRLPAGMPYCGPTGPEGLIAVDEVAAELDMTKVQLAETAGLRAETLQRTSRATAAKTQRRIGEILEIVRRVADWAGGKRQAMAWYRAYPIPSFGGRTAESLVKDGKAAAVRDYLDRVATGGFT